MPPIKYPEQEADRLASALKIKAKATTKIMDDEWRKGASRNACDAVLQQFASSDATIRRICERII